MVREFYIIIKNRLDESNKSQRYILEEETKRAVTATLHSPPSQLLPHHYQTLHSSPPLSILHSQIISDLAEFTMCCGKICMMCTCLILVVIAIGMLFGFGVFSRAFHKVNNELHYSYSPSSSGSGRPFFDFAAPPF
ncbi:hypothetical protein R6Q57_006540 [Mikania cordata]